MNNYNYNYGRPKIYNFFDDNTKKKNSIQCIIPHDKKACLSKIICYN